MMINELIIAENWKVIKNDIYDVGDMDKSKALNYLIEDMFQVENGNILIDAGWYENFDQFIIYMIKDYNWEEPIIKIYASSPDQCLNAIEFCLNYAKLMDIHKTY